MYLLKYQRTDGAIVALWSANTWDVLAPNVREDAGDAAYLAYEGPESVPELLEQRHVRDGSVSRKPTQE